MSSERRLMNGADITCVTPCYNNKRWITRALESALNQVVAPTEIIVVDDGSTDESASEIAKYGSKITAIRQENRGPAAARNRGVAEARGEWIAFLDADDAWLPERLSVQLELARQHPDVGMWCGETIVLRDEGGNLKPESRSQETEDREKITVGGQRAEASVSFRPLPLAAFAMTNPVATSTVLVRKKVIEEVGGFDQQFRGPEDYELWMRIAARHKVMKIEWPLARYREVPGSLSLDDERFLPEVLRVIRKAYGPAGVMRGVGRPARAMAYQHLAASWSAAHRGASRRAWRLLLRSLLLWPPPLGMGSNLPWCRTRLLAFLVRNCVL